MGGLLMKRYWKLIIIITISVVTIGSYYIQSRLEASHYPKFEIKQISGDEKELENISLYGNYSVDDMYFPLKIMNGKTIYLNQFSYLDQLLQVSQEFNQIMDQHKSFLRRKTLDVNNFYEDQDRILYVDSKSESLKGNIANNFIFTIEMLDKKTGDKINFKTNVSNAENYSWITVNDVQLINGKIKLLANVFTKEGKEELHAYTIDIDNKKIESDKDILTNNLGDGNGETLVAINNDIASLKPSKYALVLLQKYQENMNFDNEQSNPELTMNECYVFNYASDKIEKIPIADDQQGTFERASLNNSTVFIQSRFDKHLTVSSYEIESGRWNNKILFDVPKSPMSIETDLHDEPFIMMRNGKLYMISEISEGHSLYIGDLSTGQSLYEGKILMKKPNPDRDHKDSKIYFNLIE